MNSVSSFRLAAVALMFGAAVVTLGVPAVAGGALSLKQMSNDPIPTPTPIIGLEKPPFSVASASASQTCANDEFDAFRTVPMPVAQEVTVCGTVVALPDASSARGEGHPSFAVNTDGTPLIPIVLSGSGTFTFAPGDTVVVRGRYVRAASGAEWIDHTNQVVSRSWSQPGYVIMNGTMHQ